MGCDIHLYTESRRTINNEKKWINVDNWKLNPYYDGIDKNEKEYEVNHAYRERNYNLFAMLADVRNYSNQKVISNAKGIPTDASEVVKTESNDYGDDGHSHSWLTMKELYDFFKENPNENHSGLVDAKGAKKIENGEMPDWWCQSSNREDLIYKEWTVKNETLAGFIKTLEEHFETKWHIEEYPEDYRIVFFFDN